tara:strand:+ start:495 stop:1499 length:1005 start_codon:yes stop_codon:yes gene_type:complete
MNSYINIGNLNTINAELSNYCNSACPMCPRFDFNLNLIKDITNNAHTTLKIIIDKIGPDILSKINHFYSCGVLGDGAMNPECYEIYEYVKSCGAKATALYSNGGLRNTEFWKSLATTQTQVIFAIDGLEDTNHLYRRNVKWTKLIENVEAFINAGGHATWDYLKFKHNQNQIEQAELLSKKLGFKKFRLKETTRWNDFDSEGNWVERDHIKLDNYKLEKIERDTEASGHHVTQKTKVKESFTKAKINCWSYHKNKSEIYIAANGDVSPCCWLGDLRLHEAKNIITDYNAINLNHCSLDEILNGHFFTELAKGIRGVENAYRLQTCYHTCGVSNV